ncbi:hypothetical protein DL762_002214 [Monosporascus cannonballus]|uniref:Extracellular membrane protein CFEM domain-containing protein n=1 Tax=Monosporascus cannonballus TaxID=155416 RepID=A0ABY0HEV1_9PEZI|nr:hypothetical protein DL762_002214 [Monosporascus cannonballus]RYP01327.1 hypothetical protein DL763_000299 [Monosporascus cannonballus]
MLAPCAASAVSGNVQSQTQDSCPEAVEELQSCICTKNNNLASISREISSSVSYSCGGTASDDQASAASVLSAYCSQADITPFPEPAEPVSEYIVDLPAYQELAPCARSGVSRAMGTMTYSLCPTDASHLATCACNKNQNSLVISQGINTSVKYYCSHTADISSAQAVFAGYCGLNNGTSSFPQPSGPPGDMTYYITALNEYSALAPCAGSAVSYGVQSQSYDLCPDGPQALAACVCLKEGISRIVSSVITSRVRLSCGSTATEDITSALEVLDYYCSAAKAEVTPGGVTESETASPTAEAGNTGLSGPTQTSEPTPGFDDTDGSGDSGSDSSGFDNLGFGGSSGEPNSGGPNGRPAASNTGAIVGGVIGGVVGLALIGTGVFFIWRRSTKAKGEVAAGGGLPPNYSPSPSGLNAKPPPRTNNVSPASITQKTSELYGRSPTAQASELHAQSPGPQMSELHGQNASPSQTTNAYSPASGTQGASSQPVHEAPVQHPTQVHEMHAQPETTWQAGPIMQYHEMDGGPYQSRAQ